ncbi:MAG: TonB-dependent receptor [Bacteroidota bacterium]
MKATNLKTLIFSTLILFTFHTILAQQATIKGRITDKDNGEALISATLQVGETGTVSDYDGNYFLQVPAGEYLLEVSYIGYEDLQRTITLTPGESREININLTTAATLLQTATVTSGKYEKPLGEVTVSMEVLKPRLLEAINTTAVDEVLEKVPGVTIIDGQANIRGGSGWSYGAGSRVLLLIDDIPALQGDAGRPNWSDIPVENADQIEIVKGAASALYGSAALNGIINFRTGYATSKPITKIGAFYTTFNSPKNKSRKWWDSPRFQSGINVLHKQKIDKLDLVLSGFGLYRNGVKEASDSRRARVTIGTRYRLTDRLSFGFNSIVNWNKSEGFFYWKNAEEGMYQADSSTITNGERVRFNIDPFVSYFDQAGNRHKFMGRYFDIDNQNSDNQSNSSALYYGEYQFQRKIEPIDLVLTAGVVGIRSNISAELYGDTTFTSSNMAGYVQLDKKLFGRLNLSAGARYERNKIVGPEETITLTDTIRVEEGTTVEAKPVFRFGLNYQAAKATYFRASWGQGYRFPTIAEKYISTNVGGASILPNPELTSETGWSAEVGVKQGFMLGDWGGYLDVAAFVTEYDNMMEFRFNFTLPPGFQSQNIGGTRIKGIDFTLAGQGKMGAVTTNILAGYTYIDPKFQEFTEDQERSSSVDYNILKYRFKHSMKFDVESSYQQFSLGAAGFYNSYMEAIDRVLGAIIPGLTDYREANQNGNWRFDLRASYRFNESLKLAVIVNNVLNEIIINRPGVVDPTRNITFRADYQF